MPQCLKLLDSAQEGWKRRNSQVVRRTAKRDSGGCPHTHFSPPFLPVIPWHAARTPLQCQRKWGGGWTRGGKGTESRISGVGSCPGMRLSRRSPCTRVHACACVCNAKGMRVCSSGVCTLRIAPNTTTGIFPLHRRACNVLVNGR